MKYYVKIEDPKESKNNLHFDKNQLTSVTVSFDSPDDVKSKMAKIENMVEISGKLDLEAQENYAVLTKWALQDSSNGSAYRKVTIWIVGNDEKLFRKMIYPNCFVVDYKETYIEEKGNAETETDKMKLKIKQQVDKLDAIEILSDAKKFEPTKAGFNSNKTAKN